MSTEKFSNAGELIGHLNSGLLEKERLHHFFVGENDIVEAIHYNNQWFFTVFTREGCAPHVLSQLTTEFHTAFPAFNTGGGRVWFLENESYILSWEKFDELKTKFNKGWMEHAIRDGGYMCGTPPHLSVPYYRHKPEHDLQRSFQSQGVGRPDELASAQLHRERQTLSKCKTAGILAFSLLVGVGAAALYSWKAGLFAAHAFTLSTIAPPVAIALGVAFLLSMALAAVTLCCSRRKKSQSNSWAAFHRSEGSASGSGKSTMEFDPYFSSATSSFSHQ